MTNDPRHEREAPAAGDPADGGSTRGTDPRSRPGVPGTPGATGEDLRRPEWPDDPGSYIGHEPERSTETLPEDLGPRDERIASNATQGTGVGRQDERGQPPDRPDGHRFADDATDRRG